MLLIWCLWIICVLFFLFSGGGGGGSAFYACIWSSIKYNTLTMLQNCDIFIMKYDKDDSINISSHLSVFLSIRWLGLLKGETITGNLSKTALLHNIHTHVWWTVTIVYFLFISSFRQVVWTWRRVAGLYGDRDSTVGRDAAQSQPVGRSMSHAQSFIWQR